MPKLSQWFHSVSTGWLSYKNRGHTTGQNEILDFNIYHFSIFYVALLHPFSSSLCSETSEDSPVESLYLQFIPLSLILSFIWACQSGCLPDTDSPFQLFFFSSYSYSEWIQRGWQTLTKGNCQRQAFLAKHMNNNSSFSIWSLLLMLITILQHLCKILYVNICYTFRTSDNSYTFTWRRWDE